MTTSILVVDDEETARMVISEFLRSKGYEVLEAGTLGDARIIVKEGKADVIILDVQLPDGYGPHLLDEVARLPMRPQVIIITAHGEVSMAVDAMKAGAQDFIEKPLDLIKLEAAVKRANEVISMRRELNHWRASLGKIWNLSWVHRLKWHMLWNSPVALLKCPFPRLSPAQLAPVKKFSRALFIKAVRALVSLLLTSTARPFNPPCSNQNFSVTKPVHLPALPNDASV